MAIALALSAVPASAGNFGSSRFGFQGGLTYSSASIKNFETKSVSQYHVGVTAQFPVGMGFCIQPSLLYQVKGMSLDQIAGSSADDVINSIEGKVGFAEIPVQVQWGPDLLLFRPYVFAEPFIGYRLHEDIFSSSDISYADEMKKLEYGFGVGAGIDIWKLQVSAKWFWNMGTIYRGESESLDKLHGLSVTLSIFF